MECGDRKADSHPNGSYRHGLIGGVLAGREDIGIRIAGYDGESVGCEYRNTDSHPNGPYVSGLFSGVLAGREDAGVGFRG